MLIALVVVPQKSYAQSKVDIRAGTHADYSRLVFDWDKAPTYKVTKNGGALNIEFNAQSAASVSAVNQEKLKNIGTVDITSKAGAPLALSVAISEKSNFRHFKIGKKIIIDVYNAAGEPSRKAAQNTSIDTSKNKATETAKQAVKDIAALAKNNSQVRAELKEPLQDLNYAPVAGQAPHVITLTSTKNFGAAVFERAGFLWMVFNRADLKTDPVISGPDKKNFPKFEKIQLKNATAYRMAKPRGYYFYGEGGGLLWRIIATPNPRQTKPIRPKVINSELFWPLKKPLQVATVNDPLIGDEIKVVMVEDATEYAGPRRQYVDLEVLPSTIGVAFVPLADNIETTRNEEGVFISKPLGLAISSSRDIAAVELKDDVQKENQFFTEEEKTERLSKIFDFRRWEMGGTNALERNRRIIMRDVGTKLGAAKVEDLITLAKLNIANDRGQEALGLLRVAAQELPGIDEDAEFIALQGAAATLAAKYDEAIELLSSPKLEKVGEINYWRSAALAGLEDWRQAAETMPADNDLLSQYPVQLQIPLALKLTEVSLRGAKAEKAEEFLELLQPAFQDMSNGNQSAWKYLNGELERQKGNADKAMDNWKPLLDGRDDYYRAKAALSATRLQLERRKITKEKAIDRLEGLRYAWRGDELESLINLRLGEVYIDNGDYLKGLSTLRNAVSMSPDSKITEEVTSYMTQTFESLFTEGKLKNISALDAVSIYDEFKELTPAGQEGDVFVQELAERLVDVDLLGRAADLLDHQMEHRLTGGQAVNVGIRLAAIRLLDGKPQDALRALDMASKQITGGRAGERRQIRLLRARALSKSGQADQALALLKDMGNNQDVLRLRADIAWNGSVWSEAAKAFNQLIALESISKTRPPNDYQTTLILNRAIALNLSGSRSALDSLRAEYGDLMTQSDKGKLFDLVSRPRKLGMLSDRSTVGSLISEVDLFGDFLESYRKIN